LSINEKSFFDVTWNLHEIAPKIAAKGSVYIGARFPIDSVLDCPFSAIFLKEERKQCLFKE
jgi:hypothetical protein